MTDATMQDAEGGTVVHTVKETVLFEDTGDAGLVDSGSVKVDPNLVNPWGLAFSPTGVAWISDNQTDLATTYTSSGLGPLVVPVPAASDDDAGSPTSRPTGQIFNASAAEFDGDRFIISTEEGTIYGWQTMPADAGDAGGGPGIRYDGLAQGAVFMGLAIVPQTSTDGAPTPVLLAADFHNAAIDVFDSNYHPVSQPATVDGGAAWVDPDLPAADAGVVYAPFNISTSTVGSGQYVYVAYAVQDSAGRAARQGLGLGSVAQFGTDGTFIKTLVSPGGALDAPWGLAVVPSTGWGSLPSSTLLVGNLGVSAGVSSVNAYDAVAGTWLGNLVDSAGSPLQIDGLWALAFGVNTDAGESSQQLYFTAGPAGQSHGLFGYFGTSP
jgi:uncharacterized protein (TIGR03118 family)